MMLRGGNAGPSPALKQQRFLLLALFIGLLVASVSVLHYSHSRAMQLFEAKVAHALEGPMHVLDRAAHDRHDLHGDDVAASISAGLDAQQKGGGAAGGAIKTADAIVAPLTEEEQAVLFDKRRTASVARLAKLNKLYVSLSSVPGRLPRMLPVLRGLLNQTRPADAIFIALPWWSTRETSFYQLPDFLQPGGEMYDRVTVLRDSYDWGPATKMITLIRTLKARGEHNSRIVVVDDDQIYHSSFLEAYDKWSLKLPNNALAMRGHKTIQDNFDWWTLLSHNIMHAYETHEPTCIDIMTAVGSYMVRPRYYTAELWEGIYVHGRDTDKAGKLPGARNADDVWISGMLARNKVARTLIPGRLRAWDNSMPASEYEAGMWVKPWVLIHFKGTPELGGGGGDENASLLRFFSNDWGCRGMVHTMASCAEVKDSHGVVHQKRLMPTAPCRKTDGTGYLDGAVFTAR